MGEFTDLGKMQSVFKNLLDIRIEECKDLDPMIVVMHPIFQSSIFYIPKNNEILNICKNKKDLLIAKNYMKTEIEKINNPYQIISMIRKEYRLFYFNIIKECLSEKDYNELLKMAWSNAENIVNDPNISLPEIIRLFENSNREYLMSEEENNTFNQLPEYIKIYRGVKQKYRNNKGMSWTLDRKKAEWFANRFDNNGYLISGTINKKDVLGYFNCRNENEIICDWRKVKRDGKE